MPSPFPGIDPYLEAGGFWESFHTQLVVRIVDNLQPQLVPRYVARPTEREGVLLAARSIVPDVRIHQTSSSAARGETVVLNPLEPRVVQLVEEEYVETRVEIRHRPSAQLVTVIEVISPSNKQSGEGNRLYTRKQADLLEAPVNLVEIDLLRGGRHTVAVPPDSLVEHEPYDFLISIHRAGARGRFEVYPLQLEARLPPIRIPLLAEDADAALDLGAVYQQAYDAGYYHLDIDYTQDPQPPLPTSQAAWLAAVLREAGLRSA